MIKIAKTITDRNRLDFLIKYASAPPILQEGLWHISLPKGNRTHTFIGSTPRIALDQAITKFEGRKLYTYRQPPGWNKS